MPFTATVDRQGRLTLPQPVVRDLGPCPLELISRSDRHLLLSAPAADHPVVLAGVLGTLEITDLLSFFNIFRKSGVLRFELAGGTKDIFYLRGEIVNATTTFPEEELGEVLFDLGKVTRETLRQLRPLAASREAFGNALVERGILTPKDLWLSVRQQVEAIIYNLFSCHCGSFAFIQREVEESESLRLSLGTQNMIMEGLRRTDERELFLRRLRSLDAVPVLTGKPAETAGSAAKEILGHLDGRTTIREAVRRSGLGEFEGLRLLYQAVEKGTVRIEELPAAAVEGELGKIIEIFNAALAALYRRVNAVNPRFRQEVQLFLRDLPQPFSYLFRDVSLGADGTVDGGRLAANLGGLEKADQKKLLADGLSELVFMECHAARRELGAAESSKLTQRVQELSVRVKALTGRK